MSAPERELPAPILAAGRILAAARAERDREAVASDA